MNPPTISPQEAADQLAADPTILYLDVRTAEEFSQGHAPNALNIPIFLTDPATGGMTPNPEFTLVAQAVLEPGSTCFVCCASGTRSRQAIVTLGDFGYFRLTNVEGGFTGLRSPSGEVIRSGWSQCGLPIEPGDGGENGWASLRRR